MPLLELPDGRIEHWEAGSGPPLVFIHGAGTPGSIFRDELADLASDCRFITYDRRGYGASSASPLDWAAHASDAERLIEGLGAAPATVAGFSGGAIVALDLALRRPDLLSALVLLDPVLNLKRIATPAMLRHVMTAKLLRRLRGERRGAEHWMRYVSSYSTGGSAFEKSPPERRARLLDEAAGMFADSASGAGDHLDEPRLRDIAVPVTLVSCALSPPFLRRSCERLAALLPQAQQITLEHSGHHLTLDAREDVLRILRAALPSARTVT